MIDSSYDARVDRYVKRCFPQYAVNIKFLKDSFSLCSVETVLMVAPDISEDQIPVLEQFMTNMAHYYNSLDEHVHFDYGFVPGSIDTNFDRMFSRREIYVSSMVKVTTHSTVSHLLAVFNKITDGYTGNQAGSK